MAGFSTQTNEHLIRSNLWSKQLKEPFMEQLFATRYCRMLTEFPDGTTFNMPSIGQMEAQDYVEGQPVRYTAMDTGNYTFTINKYKQSGTYITEKMKLDSFYMSQLVASFVPKQARAIAEAMETDFLAAGPDGQTASALNAINGANHRFVASGTDEVMTFEDFAYARYALKKAGAPLTDLVAIVDPSVAWEFEVKANVTNLLTPAQRWQSIVHEGVTTGMQFRFNLYGFDVYESNFLKDVNETIDGKTTTAGKANLFFTATGDANPFLGLVRQPPKVDSEYNKDFQREEYVTTCYYGFDLFREDSLVTILSDTDKVLV